VSAANSPDPGNSPKPPDAHKVPEELLQKLHEANERFSAARERREKAMDEPTPEETNRERAQQEMLESEQAVEKVTDEIDRDFERPI
jgi:hypothetical protein